MDVTCQKLYENGRTFERNDENDDDCDRYVREKGMHIPLYDELFAGTAAAPVEGDLITATVPGERERMTATPGILWTGRGLHPEFDVLVADAPYASAVDVIHDAAGNPIPVLPPGVTVRGSFRTPRRRGHGGAGRRGST